MWQHTDDQIYKTFLKYNADLPDNCILGWPREKKALKFGDTDDVCHIVKNLFYGDY